MSRGPAPSRLCLLSSLPDRPEGEKVRFVGCVTAYSTASASLVLNHAHPRGTNVTASVNLELVLEALHPDLTRIGEWVNVIGYLAAAPPRSSASGPGGRDVASVHVQALLLWSTGPLDIQRYEQSLETAVPGHAA
ncbi:hypothetical protein CDD83_9276 [Cordyceps sp. RAO-2017]|nr:hypothetical protein CDD83_9276 [Cordyceps sp. RAO-2017]